MIDRLAGIMPVLQTALTADGDLDLTGMQRQIEFCIRAGADGLVFPVLGSEFMFLSDNERRDLVAFVVKHADGRIPIVAGVAGASAAIAVEQAAMPPMSAPTPSSPCRPMSPSPPRIKSSNISNALPKPPASPLSSNTRPWARA